MVVPASSLAPSVRCPLDLVLLTISQRRSSRRPPRLRRYYPAFVPETGLSAEGLSPMECTAQTVAAISCVSTLSRGELKVRSALADRRDQRGNCTPAE